MKLLQEPEQLCHHILIMDFMNNRNLLFGGIHDRSLLYRLGQLMDDLHIQAPVDDAPVDH